MTENKLQLDADKTETILFNSSKLKRPPAPLSVCQATISFSDGDRHLDFYKDKDLSMKAHINFVCKTAFLEIRRISTIRNDLSDDATETLVVSLVFLRTDYCNSLGLSRSVLGRQTSESPKLCRHLHWLPVRPRIFYRLQASVSTPSPPPPLLISLTFYICTLLLDLFAPVPTPASSKFHSRNARQKVIVLSLTLVILSGTHCKYTLELLQLSTSSSLL